MAGSLCLFVRYRNHFPLSNFKTKHIFGILMTLRKVSIWGALKEACFDYNFFFSNLLPPPKALPNGRPGRPKRGDEGAVPPEGDSNLADGGCFASHI